MPGKGIDVVGAGAESSTNVGGEVRKLNTAQSPSILLRAVVVEVLYDISVLDVEIEGEEGPSTIREDLASFITNPLELEKDPPRNSIIAQPVTLGMAKKVGPLLCYPFFPPHMCFPIKPGEQVWLISESPDMTQGPGYWMARIPEPNYVDDVNYTHGDRKLGDTSKPDEKSTDEDVVAPNFINGQGDADAYTLKEETEYEDIVYDSPASDQHTFEPVPRFTKRPGDFVIQGSNNTLICLGEDRGWSYIDPLIGEIEFSNATKTEDQIERTGDGAIDIVAGRGRFLPEPEGDPEIGEPFEDSTHARTIKNSRGYFEADKNPVKTGADTDSNAGYNVTEGDPDLINDASRVYVAMKTDVDENLGLEYPNVPSAGDSNAGKPVEPTQDAATIFLMSDQIRIVARQVDETDISPEIKGSIKIIKEGDPDDESGKGRGVIIIQPDGVIMIDGPKVVIGSGIEKAHGAGAQVAIGLDAEEPLVMGNALAKTLTTLLQAILSNAPMFSQGASPNALSPAIIQAVTQAMTDLGGPSAAPATNITLSKVAKTK